MREAEKKKTNIFAGFFVSHEQGFDAISLASLNITGALVDMVIMDWLRQRKY